MPMITNLNSNAIPKRLVWADIIRLIAIFLVICIHCSNSFGNLLLVREHPGYNFWSIVFETFSRPCVPLFVMLTGMLLLPINQDPSTFYRKRILRVLIPFLIWSVLYNLFPWVCGLTGIHGDTLSMMFVGAGSNPSQSLWTSLQFIALSPIQFGPYTIHMWYIYMLLGLYLYMPIVSLLIKHSTRHQQNCFLLLWVLTLFLPYLRELMGNNILGSCAWNPFDLLYYFAGFHGYLLLGYRLKESIKINKWGTILLGAVLWIIGYAITFYGFVYMANRGFSSPSQAELFMQYCSINVAMMSVGIWLIIRQICISSTMIQALLANLTKCGYGIYLFHYFMVGLAVSFVSQSGIPIPTVIPFAALLTFLISWFVVFFLYKLFPKVSKWIWG